MEQRKRNYTYLSQSFSRVFTHVRAGGSLKRGVSYGEARVRAKTLTLVSKSFTGETKKEPRFFFIPTFQKEDFGFYTFTGFRLRVVKPGGGAS